MDQDAFGNAEANLRFLRDTDAVRPGLRVLEIGSGHGALLRHLREAGCAAVGVETSAARIAESRRRQGALPIAQVSGAALPFRSGAFDLVLSFDVFEHIRDSDQHVMEVARVLAPSGRYLLQTPNKWTNTIFETIRWRSFTSWRPDHCALHSYAGLRRRFERHGFTVRFHDVPVVTSFFRQKVSAHLGVLGTAALRVVNPDRLPMPLRTNFYVEASRL